MSKTVNELMTQPVITCRSWDNINDAAHLMWRCDRGCLPVVDDAARLVGMLTDRDICMAAYTRGVPLVTIPVAVAMSTTVVSCRPHDEIATVYRRMAQWQVRRIPVVDEDGRVVGVVSLSDLVRQATPDARDSLFSVSNDDVLRTLSCVSAPARDAYDEDYEAEAWEDEGGSPTGVWARVGEQARNGR